MISEADFSRLLRAPGCCLVLSTEGDVSDRLSGESAILPGSFNPIHEGHWQLAATAQRVLSRPVTFELSVRNVDKPALGFDDVRSRLAQFAGRAPVAVTCAPLFVDKAALFPGSIFAVGADTVVRLVEPGYYGGDTTKMHEALARIASTGCSFLVAGRKDSAGRWISLADIAVPESFQHLFRDVADFRCDVSSSELRQSGVRG